MLWHMTSKCRCPFIKKIDLKLTALILFLLCLIAVRMATLLMCKSKLWWRANEDTLLNPVGARTWHTDYVIFGLPNRERNTPFTFCFLLSKFWLLRQKTLESGDNVLLSQSSSASQRKGALLSIDFKHSPITSLKQLAQATKDNVGNSFHLNVFCQIFKAEETEVYLIMGIESRSK